MLLLKVLGVSLAVVILSLISLVVFPIVSSISHDSRTRDVSESLSCTTAASATSCSVTLAGQHAHGSASHITVTEISPGSGARTNLTLDTPTRLVLTIGSLSEGTTYTFTVSYERRRINMSTDLDTAMSFTPILVTVFILVAGFVGLGFFLKHATR